MGREACNGFGPRIHITQVIASRPMRSTQKKIIAIFIFATAGFFCGFFGIAQAAVLYDTTGALGSGLSYGGTGYNFPLPSTGSSNWEYMDVWFQTAGTHEIAIRNPAACSKNQTFSFTAVSGKNTVHLAFTPPSGYLVFDADSSCNYGNDEGVTSVPSHGAIEPYYVIYDAAPAPPTTASTTLDTISPSGTIASSSPITITITGHIGTADFGSSTIRLLSRVSGRDTNFVSPASTYNITSDGAFSYSYQVTTSLPAGQFQIYASLTSYNASSSPQFDCSALATGGICIPIGGINVASTTNFTMNSSYFESFTGTSTPSNLAYKNAPCGISDLSGCFQNALAALFYPTISPGAAFNSISDEAHAKFPFVYVYQLGAIRTALLTASSTSATSVTVNLWKLGSSATTTINLISQNAIAAVPFSNTIYTVLTWLIWLGMAEYIYYRVIRMHDTHTPT